MANKKLSSKEIEKLINTLEKRFATYPKRHEGIKWSDVEKKLKASSADKITSLRHMEATGGEPDVIGYDKKSKEYIFCDCSAETPKDRRSICYDRKALNSR